MANKLKKVMKPILKQKCSESWQEGYKKGMWMGFKQKNLAYESEIDCLKKIQFALHKSVPKWIPVTERLPNEAERVVVIMPNGSRLVGRILSGKWHIQGLRKETKGVTHWMPLPAPPEEDAR